MAIVCEQEEGDASRTCTNELVWPMLWGMTQSVLLQQQCRTPGWWPCWPNHNGSFIAAAVSHTRMVGDQCWPNHNESVKVRAILTHLLHRNCLFFAIRHQNCLGVTPSRKKCHILYEGKKEPIYVCKNLKKYHFLKWLAIAITPIKLTTAINHLNKWSILNLTDADMIKTNWRGFLTKIIGCTCTTLFCLARSYQPYLDILTPW